MRAETDTTSTKNGELLAGIPSSTWCAPHERTYGLATRTRPTFSGNQADEVPLSRLPIRRDSTRERKPEGQRSSALAPRRHIVKDLACPARSHQFSHTRGLHPVSSTATPAPSAATGMNSLEPPTPPKPHQDHGFNGTQKGGFLACVPVVRALPRARSQRGPGAVA